MNLLSKSKYRTKIIDHLLHQTSNQQSLDQIEDQNQNHLQHYNPPKNTQIDQLFSKSMIFEKASKQKPLISDTQNTQRLNQNRSNKKDLLTQINFNQNYHPNHSKNNKIIQKDKFSSKKTNDNIPDIKIKGHLKQQSFFYHQKLPILQVSNHQSHEILKKIRKNIQNELSKQNKQNVQKNSNSNLLQDSQRQKKYKFVIPSKVSEALTLRKKEQNKNQTQTVQKKSQHKIQNHMNLETAHFNETKRSKGSKQMLEFLQSARQKLFQNMNQKETQLNPQNDNLFSNNNCQNEQTPLEKDHQNFKQRENFKIQIQVSSDKTVQIELNLNSDAKKVSRNFIESNLNQLSSFDGLKIQTLGILLSNKIMAQVEKRKKMVEIKKRKNSIDNQHQTIDHNRVNYTILKDQKSQKRILKSQQKMKSSIQKQKKQQLQHVYLQNLDIQISNEQCPSNRKKSPFNRQSPQMNKIISFDPSSQKSNFTGSQQNQIKLGGYLSSPHQLITYRPDTPQLLSQNQKRNDSNFNENYDNQGIISHFPLSTKIAEVFNGNKIEKNNQEKISNIENDSQQIGAAKILARSRSKSQKRKYFANLSNIKNQSKQQHILDAKTTSHSPFQTQVNPQLNTKPQSDNKNSFLINNISSRIVAKLGKQNIITSLKEKQNTKKQKILQQKQQKQLQEMKQCSFKPKINNLSKTIDQNKKKKIKIGQFLQNDVNNQKYCSNTTDRVQFQIGIENKQLKEKTQFDKIMSKIQKPQQRFQELYENHKTIEAKKQYNRQKSLEQISFKPQLNPVSKKIIQTKRNSLNNSICQEYNSLVHSRKTISQFQSTCKKQSKRNSVQYFNDTYYENKESKMIQKKRKSLNLSRNLEGLEIGEYLYKQAMRMKKKKDSCQVQKVQNFKPLIKSQKIMNEVRQKRLSQYFDQLLNIESMDQMHDQNYELLLTPQSIDLSQERYSYQPLKYLVPLLEELKELNVGLTRQQFIESGMKLINSLSQDQKADFLSKKSHENLQRQQYYGQPCLNKLSLQLIEKRQDYIQDIYHRGLIYKKQIKEKIQSNIERKVRKQLQKCTFKPKINTLHHINQRNF